VAATSSAPAAISLSLIRPRQNVICPGGAEPFEPLKPELFRIGSA